MAAAARASASSSEGSSAAIRSPCLTCVPSSTSSFADPPLHLRADDDLVGVHGADQHQVAGARGRKQVVDRAAIRITPSKIRNLLRAFTFALLYSLLSEQCRRDKIQHRRPGVRRLIRGPGDQSLYHTQNRGINEMEDDHGNHRRNKVHRIDGAKVSRLLSLRDHGRDLADSGRKYCFTMRCRCGALPRAARIISLCVILGTVDDRRCSRSARARRRAISPAAAGRSTSASLNACRQTSKNLIEDSGVKSFLVLEVVVEQSFVDSGSAGDGIGAGPGDAFTGKFAHRGLQDGSPAFFGPSAGAEARFGRAVFGGILINRLVR